MRCGPSVAATADPLRRALVLNVPADVYVPPSRVYRLDELTYHIQPSSAISGNIPRNTKGRTPEGIRPILRLSFLRHR